MSRYYPKKLYRYIKQQSVRQWCWSGSGRIRNFNRILILKRSFRIRIRAAPEFHLIKKNYHKAFKVSSHNPQANTLTRREHKCKIYVKNIRKEYSRRIRYQLKRRIRIRKKSFRIHPNTGVRASSDLFLRMPTTLRLGMRQTSSSKLSLARPLGSLILPRRMYPFCWHWIPCTLHRTHYRLLILPRRM